MSIFLSDDVNLWKGNWSSTKRASKLRGNVDVILKDKATSPYTSYGFLEFTGSLLKNIRIKCNIKVDPRYNMIIGTYKLGSVKTFTMKLTISKLSDFIDQSVKHIDDAMIMSGEYTGPADKGSWVVTITDERNIGEKEVEPDDGGLL